MNDRTAKLLVKAERFPNGANSPTIHKEYSCPCGQGKIIEEYIPGFDDRTVKIDCALCASKYSVVQGCGSIWALNLI